MATTAGAEVIKAMNAKRNSVIVDKVSLHLIWIEHDRATDVVVADRCRTNRPWQGKPHGKPIATNGYCALTSPIVGVLRSQVSSPSAVMSQR